MVKIGEEDDIVLVSVGLDIGSSTSHLIFSRLTLRKEKSNYTRKYEIINRDILYAGRIIDTPLLDPTTIDVETLVHFFEEEYERAGMTRDMIDTGAVITTGETAKKKNADEIVARLSAKAGDFVAATAGPNFESMLAAFGSGMTRRSKEVGTTIISADIGGGTSNIAMSKDGEVIATSCINVGGRLVAYDHDRHITRIDAPAARMIERLGLRLQLGNIITETQLQLLSKAFADALLDAMMNHQLKPATLDLMMTPQIDDLSYDEVCFSGGVSEYIYGDAERYNDMGWYLAEALKERMDEFHKPIIEPLSKIRATVIGAGSYSLSISGSTCYVDEHISFPLRNIPVVRVDVDRTNLSEDELVLQVGKSLGRFDIVPGTSAVAFYFKDPVRAAYNSLKIFAKGIAMATQSFYDNGIPIILIFERDIANSVGNVIRRETHIKDNLLCLDELDVKEGDWIDIGAPMINGQVFPTTIKSLVFNKD